jgi:hypothetical protein
LKFHTPSIYAIRWSLLIWFWLLRQLNRNADVPARKQGFRYPV